MNNMEELLDDGDTSDDDYVPDSKKTEDLSEVDSDGDSEDNLVEEEIDEKSIKRKKGSRQPQKRQKIHENRCTDSTSLNQLCDEEKKKTAEDVWADFMKDTGFQSRKSITTNKVTPPTTVNSAKPSSANKPLDKVKITKIFEFAGEEVAVEKEVPVDSAEAKLLNKSESVQQQNKNRSGLSGISGILSQLGKKPKISTLEKSKLDWDKFKKEENLEEELQTHNKGKDGYLERQDFLQRADLRRFEIEKEIRTTERNRRINNSL